MFLLERALRPAVDPATWAARYGIEPLRTECSECGAAKVTDIPIASGKLRGLAAKRCSCGSDSDSYCLVAVQGDLFDFWGSE